MPVNYVVLGSTTDVLQGTLVTELGPLGGPVFLLDATRTRAGFGENAMNSQCLRPFLDSEGSRLGPLLDHFWTPPGDHILAKFHYISLISYK